MKTKILFFLSVALVGLHVLATTYTWTGAAKSGCVAVALSMPAMANAAPDDVNSADSRTKYLALLPERADGKTEKTVTWAAMQLRKRGEEP